MIIEKPFGTDLASAEQLNAVVHAVFSEQQVYRIDHYLGKETVQNLLVLRFANTIFEPIWNRNYIDHVQITVAEEVDVGRRAGYYDTAGVVRDMFQNHLLQLLMITAMEAPVRYEADAVRDEKVKVLQAIRPLTPRRRPPRHAPRPVSRLRQRRRRHARQPHRHVRRDQAVDRQLALAGRAVLSAQRQGDVLPHDADRHPIPRAAAHAVSPTAREARAESNRLVIQVQPAEGIQLHFETKVPDAGMKLRQTDLDFRYQREFRGAMPEAYERLLLDALEGDASLFARADEVEAAWAICDPILDEWQTQRQAAAAHLRARPAGAREESTEWMAAQGRQWFDTARCCIESKSTARLATNCRMRQ